MIKITYLFIFDGLVEVLVETRLNQLLRLKRLKQLDDQFDPDSARLAAALVLLQKQSMTSLIMTSQKRRVHTLLDNDAYAHDSDADFDEDEIMRLVYLQVFP